MINCTLSNVVRTSTFLYRIPSQASVAFLYRVFGCLLAALAASDIFRKTIDNASKIHRKCIVPVRYSRRVIAFERIYGKGNKEEPLADTDHFRILIIERR